MADEEKANNKITDWDQIGVEREGVELHNVEGISLSNIKLSILLHLIHSLLELINPVFIIISSVVEPSLSPPNHVVDIKVVCCQSNSSRNHDQIAYLTNQALPSHQILSIFMVQQ